MTTYEPVHGSIVHVEYYSDDVEATRAFFEEVFDWTIETNDDLEYVMWRAPNPPFGGLLAPREGPFEPPSTLVYVNVEDLETTQKSISGAGGDLLVEEMEIPEMGVFAIYRDPAGVTAAVWEDRYEGDPPDGGWPAITDDADPGSIVHFEIYTDDPEATERFHTDVFGWEFEAIGEGEYTMVQPPTPPNGGVMAAGEYMGPGILTYVLVDDIDSVCATIEEHGGRIEREPYAIDGWGTMAVFEAPGGITQALWESE